MTTSSRPLASPLLLLPLIFTEVRTRKDAKYENMKERMKERRDW